MTTNKNHNQARVTHGFTALFDRPTKITAEHKGAA